MSDRIKAITLNQRPVLLNKHLCNILDISRTNFESYCFEQKLSAMFEFHSRLIRLLSGRALSFGL